MPFNFMLPDLGEGITEGEVRKWTVKEGDMVEEHQTVLELETDKAIVEVPSPRKGRVLEIKKDEGDIAQVGEILMTLALEGEAEEQGAEFEEKKKERAKSVSVVGVLPEEEEERKAEVLATPAVRALARELGVRLETVKGSGPSGSITPEDLETVSEKAQVVENGPGPVERIPLKGLRRTIARNLMTSQRTTVSVTGMDEADVTGLWELREREKKVLE